MRTGINWIFRGIAIVVLILTIVQPVLGPFAFFRSGDSIDYETIHAIIGSVIFYLTILLVLLVFFTRFRRRWVTRMCCVALVVATFFQLGLGYESNGDAGLLAYHIPLGVLVFLLALLVAALSFGLRLTPATNHLSSR